MAVNFNSDVLKRIINDLKISVSDGVPQQIANQIVPVLISNPENLVKPSAATGTAATTNIMTTSATKDTYLVGAELGATQDAVSDNTYSYIRVYLEDGTTEQLCSIPFIATTAAQETQTITFKNPIKLKRNTAIDLKHSGTVGTTRLAGAVYYYEVDAH